MLERIDTFINYYEILGITEGADTAEIEEALEYYQESMTLQLNNSLTMQSALYAINTIIPGLRQNLLSGQDARKRYDEQLATFKYQQEQRSAPGELPDDQGLDIPLRQPFFFDPFNGYDTEPPAFTLRDIARRLDFEWERARAWILDTSTELHPLVGYLTHAALRRHLAERALQIVQAVSPRAEKPINVNEAIERCIILLNPSVERPLVSIEGLLEKGTMLNAGSYVPDLKGNGAFTLYHQGQRGCALGTIESKTPWLTLDLGQPVMRFSLMPEGTPPHIGPSQQKVPLIFDLSALAHNANHTAELIIRQENTEVPREMVLQVLIHVSALPPRVVFEPPSPLRLGAQPRGKTVSAIIIPRNRGDEHHIPLSAHISTNDTTARAIPEHITADVPITLSIDTHTRPPGTIYDVYFQVDYRATPGAQGPSLLHIQGETLPTPWQSMIREKSLVNRLRQGTIGIIAGVLLLGIPGISLSGHLPGAWLAFLLFPALLLAITRMVTGCIVIHLQRAGQSASRLSLPHAFLWWLPPVVGLGLALLCGLITDGQAAFLIGAIAGGLAGGVVGFLLDTAS
jgi:hypothetical protein